MVIVRAVTLFYDINSWDSIADVIEDIVATIGVLYDVIKNRYKDKNIWTVRLALPPLPRNIDSLKIATRISEVHDEYPEILISALHTDTSYPYMKEYITSLIETPIYGTLYLKGDPYEYKIAAETLIKISEKDPIAATRVAIVTYERVLTPYFPAAIQLRKGKGISLALLYPQDLYNAHNLNDASNIITGIYKDMVVFGRSLCENLGINWYGIDMSLSPWMEQSVARVLENLSGDIIGGLNVMSTIYDVNKIIEKTVRISGDSTGFNEIMLPVAEDNVLKQRVLEERVTLKDLLLYSTACITGVDMVVLPEDITIKNLEAVISALDTMSKVKRKPLGLRVIVYPGAKALDVVNLGRFGKTPVIKLH